MYLYSIKLEALNKMVKFLDSLKLTNLNQEDIHNLNRPQQMRKLNQKKMDSQTFKVLKLILKLFRNRRSTPKLLLRFQYYSNTKSRKDTIEKKIMGRCL